MPNFSTLTHLLFDRWEGRCLWGALIFAVINLAQQAQPMFTDKENFRRLCCLLVCFALACKNQLAGDSIEVDSEYLLSRGLISMKELKHVISRPGWQVSPRLYYFVIRTRVALANHMY